MIRHIFIAAWRNMAANRLLSAISILGLAVGIAAALLMALVVRNQLTFDGFIPGHGHIYLAASPPDPHFPAIGWEERSDYRTAPLLKNSEPEVESAARIALAWDDERDTVQHGQIRGWEQIYWADPNIFDLLKLPVLQGNLATALDRPDGIVLPRASARKYFGRDGVVGQTILVDGHPMIVRAVIADLPANCTTLVTGIFASGRATFSRLAPGDLPLSSISGHMDPDAYTYVRLRPNADLAGIEKRVAAHFAPMEGATEFPLLKLLPLAQVNMFEPLHPGSHVQVAIMGVTGLLILLIAAINFVNLTAARSIRREKEVGVRKACGAGRGMLALQFLGEAILAVILAGLIAATASEWLLPPINAFLRTGAGLGYDGDPVMILYLLLGFLALGLAAGTYPAFILSGLRPANVLRGWAPAAVRTGLVRNLLVMLQFAILVTLAISAWVIWQQRQFALHEATRSQTDRMLILQLSRADAPFPPSGRPITVNCAPVLTNELRKLAGVNGVACSSDGFLTGLSNMINQGKPWVGGRRSIPFSVVDPHLFALYDVLPLAGNFADGSGTILNMGAVRLLGFSSPASAIGHSWLPASTQPRLRARYGPHSRITAVIPDFAFYSVEKSVQPELFSQWFDGPATLIHIRLNGGDIPETLAAIDGLWAKAGMKGPENRYFLDDRLQQQYLDMTREAALVIGFALVAIALASLGLVGIAVSTAERRTKEIGIRKAMGADNRQIVALLLWQFAQPVLWANVIAWPLAWWLMHRWLAGFAYHVDLHWWVFAAASLGALTIALVTVAAQAFLTARAKPILALRYE